MRRRAALVAVAAAVVWVGCSRARQDAPTPSPTASLVVAEPSPLAAVEDTAGIVAKVLAQVERGEVSLANMALTELPVSAVMAMGTSLERLDLSRNALVELPPEIARTGVVALDLSHNRFERVPALALRWLNVQGNPIEELPEIPTLETLYVDRMIDVERMVAMTNLMEVGVDWRAVHGESRYHEISVADAWQTSAFVSADLPDKALGARSGSRAFFAPAESDLLLAADEGKLTAVGEGAGPACEALSLGTLRGLERDVLRERVKERCVALHRWTPDGPEPISLASLTVKPSPTDDCDESRREFELHAQLGGGGGWFVSAESALPRRPTVPAAKAARVSAGMTTTSAFTLPPGFAWSATRWYLHPDGAAQLALVDAHGFGGDQVPLRRMEWRGLFLVTAKAVVRLVESDPYPGCGGPHLFELGGFLDFGGDGDYDIVLLGKEPMLLERVEGGFRTHAPMRTPCTC